MANDYLRFLYKKLLMEVQKPLLVLQGIRPCTRYNTHARIALIMLPIQSLLHAQQLRLRSRRMCSGHASPAHCSPAGAGGTGCVLWRSSSRRLEGKSLRPSFASSFRMCASVKICCNRERCKSWHRRYPGYSVQSNKLNHIRSTWCRALHLAASTAFQVSLKKKGVVVPYPLDSRSIAGRNLCTDHRSGTTNGCYIAHANGAATCRTPLELDAICLPMTRTQSYAC
jgi:hypothetical protein